MIRDKNKIYAEPNDPNTVLGPITAFPEAGLMYVGRAIKGTNTYFNGGLSILATDELGRVRTISLSLELNKVIAVNDAGVIVFLDRSTL